MFETLKQFCVFWGLLMIDGPPKRSRHTNPQLRSDPSREKRYWLNNGLRSNPVGRTSPLRALDMLGMNREGVGSPILDSQIGVANPNYPETLRRGGKGKGSSQGY